MKPKVHFYVFHQNPGAVFCGWLYFTYDVHSTRDVKKVTCKRCRKLARAIWLGGK